MINYFLDTNICIFYLKNAFPNLSERFEKTETSRMKIPSITAAELLYGAEKSAKREQNLNLFKSFLSLFEIVDFDKSAAERYSELRAVLERSGQPIGGNDMIIASTVLANSGVLVTNNTREFSRIRGLRLEDWTAEIIDI